MNKIIFVGTAILLIAVLMFGCTQSQPTATASPSASAAPSVNTQQLITGADIPQLNNSIDTDIQDLANQLK